MSAAWVEPPPGWLAFGSLIEYAGLSECSDETGEDGLPLWERPLPLASEARGDVTGGGLAEAVLALCAGADDRWLAGTRANHLLPDLLANLRAAVAAATAETPPDTEVVTFRVAHCDVTARHGEHTYDYEGPILWCDGADQ